VITRLEPGDGGPVLHLDGVPVRRLPETLVAARGLHEGDRLGEDELAALLFEAEKADAIEDALRYLSYRPRSRFEVGRRLTRRGHAAPAREAAIARCEELGYVDDAAFALAFVRDRLRLRPRGPRRLVSELRARGVDPATAGEAVREVFAEEDVSEGGLMRRLARRRLRALRRLEPDTARRRLGDWLLRRGFEPSAVRALVDELVPPDPEPPA
jgi:regulatory protein